MPHDNVDTTRRALASFNRRDFDAALADAADDLAWEPFIARAETPLLRGKDEVRAAWTSQVEALDLRTEAEELLPVGEDLVVAVVRVTGRGSSSDMALSARIAWVCSFDDDGRLRGITTYPGRAEALAAAGAA